LPIIYLHGVSVRDERDWEQIEVLLRRFVAPCISDDPAGVEISRCNWSDLSDQSGARWLTLLGLSRFMQTSGLSELVGEGLSGIKDKSQALSKLRPVKAVGIKSPVSARLTESGRFQALREKLSDGGRTTCSFTRLSREALSNLLCQGIRKSGKLSGIDELVACIAADEVAFDEDTFMQMSQCKTVCDEMKLLRSLMSARFDLLRAEYQPLYRDRLSMPTIKDSVMVDLLSSTATFGKSPLEKLAQSAAAKFVYDIWSYLSTRGSDTKPGAIPRAFINALQSAQQTKLKRGGEPIVVVSHSMGGQIVYDVVTHFLPRLPHCSQIVIDFWCATASQVGLFHELKLFLESGAALTSNGVGTGTGAAGVGATAIGAAGVDVLARNRHLGYFWNVWDPSDLFSYSARAISENLDDEVFESGLDAVSAHGAYLHMPAFFRRMAAKLGCIKASSAELVGAKS